MAVERYPIYLSRDRAVVTPYDPATTAMTVAVDGVDGSTQATVAAPSGSRAGKIILIGSFATLLAVIFFGNEDRQGTVQAAYKSLIKRTPHRPHEADGVSSGRDEFQVSGVAALDVCWHSRCYVADSEWVMLMTMNTLTPMRASRIMMQSGCLRRVRLGGASATRRSGPLIRSRQRYLSPPCSCPGRCLAACDATWRPEPTTGCHDHQDRATMAECSTRSAAPGTRTALSGRSEATRARNAPKRARCAALPMMLGVLGVVATKRNGR